MKANHEFDLHSKEFSEEVLQYSSVELEV